MNPRLVVMGLALIAGCSAPSEDDGDNAAVPPVNAAALNAAEELPASESDIAATPENAPQNGSVPNEMANPEAWTRERYIGRWKGVEGMYLDVAADSRDGGVTLDMQWDLDNKGRFGGSVTAEGLRFMRNGEAEIATPSDGDATGLKYLTGKKDCLTVKPGEGYCRD